MKEGTDGMLFIHGAISMFPSKGNYNLRAVTDGRKKDLVVISHLAIASDLKKMNVERTNKTNGNDPNIRNDPNAMNNPNPTNDPNAINDPKAINHPNSTDDPKNIINDSKHDMPPQKESATPGTVLLSNASGVLHHLSYSNSRDDDKKNDKSDQQNETGGQIRDNGVSDGVRFTKRVEFFEGTNRESKAGHSFNSETDGDSTSESRENSVPAISKKIGVHRLCKRPDYVWEKLKSDIDVININPLSHSEVRPHNCLRFVCISDTHSRVEQIGFSKNVPDGDVLLHAGDFTRHGTVEECIAFNKFLGDLPHQIKLLIPGNHETLLDPSLPGLNQYDLRKQLKLSLNPQHFNDQSEGKAVKKLIDNGSLLIDSLVEICGINIYGTPWIPSFGYPAFGCHRGFPLLKKYDAIPNNVDILLSHGPPLGFGDLTSRGNHVGCVELLNTVRHRIQPKYVVSGHIHEGHGVRSDRTTTYINASICTRRYRPDQEAIIFDYPLPAPYVREDFMKLSQSDFMATSVEDA